MLWWEFWLIKAQREAEMHSEEERMRRILDLIEYFESEGNSIMEQRIAGRFRNPKALLLSLHVRNVVADVINAISLVFQETPVVVFKDKKHQEIWDTLSDELNLPAHLQTIEAYTNLCGSLLVRVDEDPAEPTGLGITYIMPSVLRVVEDPERRTRAVQFRIKRFAPSSGTRGPDPSTLPGARVPNIQADREAGADTAVRLRRPDSIFGVSPQQTATIAAMNVVYDVYTFYSDRPPTWGVESHNGDALREPIDLAYDPFVAWHSSQPVGTWFAVAPFDLLSAQNRVADHLTELGHQLRMNSFSIPVMSAFMDASGGPISTDPTRPLQKPTDEEGKEVEPLTFASPENDFTLSQLRETIKDEVEYIRQRYGLTTGEGDSASSGFMVQVLSVPLMRRVRKARTVMTPSLRRFVQTVMRAAQQQVTKDDFDVRTVDSTLPEDPAMTLQAVQVLETEIELGLTSRVRELMRRNPDLDKPAAEKLLKEIDAENKASRDANDPLAGVMGNRALQLNRLPGGNNPQE